MTASSSQPPAALDHRGLPAGYPLKPQYEVTPRQAREALQEAAANTVVLDVRLQSEHDTARIEGSTLIPLDQLETRLDELEDYKDRPIIVHCHHGVRSMKAALLLQQYGFAQARSMAGGIDLWSRDIDAKVPRYEREGSVCRAIKPA